MIPFILPTLIGANIGAWSYHGAHYAKHGTLDNAGGAAIGATTGAISRGVSPALIAASGGGKAAAIAWKPGLTAVTTTDNYLNGRFNK
ncbi:hypothetical protein [Wielerella bovis]|uniref:hypothetical protein n=1 Tax=Wielerella bovis TaxID=2917790 RepID=UPI002019043D|nr:hypothetical protein [Wielerella bovis]MCG7657692.1 hypothetical protein [Wielerella bovis]MCG7659913.1 hypothetical protein [Wielerella bovis]